MTIKVFYDGDCNLCNHEMKMYRRWDPSGENLELVNIMSPDFRASDYSLDEKAIHRWMHSIDQQGKVHVGVDSFLLVWEQMGVFKIPNAILRKQPFYALAWLGYRFFAVIRPYLPRSKSCSIS